MFKKGFLSPSTHFSHLSRHQLKERFKAEFITIRKEKRGGRKCWKKKGFTAWVDFQNTLACQRDGEYFCRWGWTELPQPLLFDHIHHISLLFFSHFQSVKITFNTDPGSVAYNTHTMFYYISHINDTFFVTSKWTWVFIWRLTIYCRFCRLGPDLNVLITGEIRLHGLNPCWNV